VSTPLRVAFRTLGCKVNRTEAEAVAVDLMGRGVEVVAEGAAEVVVVTTCTVTAESDHKARKAVRHALRGPEQPVVVVTGCLAALDPEGLRALGERVIIEADRDAVADRVAGLLGARAGAGGHVARTGTAFRTRALVKVEDGCDDFCAYCIVPHARGVPRATPLPAVVREVTELARAGTAEVVLTGINIGRYNWEGARLPELVESVAATGIPRIRLSSIEPDDVDGSLLAVAAATAAFCAHLHVPLQSGCDRTLAEMGRRYDTGRYASIIECAREALPGCAITTDVLVGFPGETDEDFGRSLAFVESVGFAKLHVFRYSRRAGTPAAERLDQVPQSVVRERARRMRELSGALHERFLECCVGGGVEALVERVANGGAEGRARNGAVVRLIGCDVRVGALVRVTVTGHEDDRLFGTPARPSLG
jgi:threonylcarbamoyladenosine tRNA methylthiotransferase MtaB